MAAPLTGGNCHFWALAQVSLRGVALDAAPPAKLDSPLWHDSTVLDMTVVGAVTVATSGAGDASVVDAVSVVLAGDALAASCVGDATSSAGAADTYDVPKLRSRMM